MILHSGPRIGPLRHDNLALLPTHSFLLSPHLLSFALCVAPARLRFVCCRHLSLHARLLLHCALLGTSAFCKQDLILEAARKSWISVGKAQPVAADSDRPWSAQYVVFTSKTVQRRRH